MGWARCLKSQRGEATMSANPGVRGVPQISVKSGARDADEESAPTLEMKCYSSKIYWSSKPENM